MIGIKEFDKNEYDGKMHDNMTHSFKMRNCGNKKSYIFAVFPSLVTCV